MSRWRIAAYFLLSALAGQPACGADLRPWAPYAEVHGIFAKFLNTPASSRSRLVFYLGVKPPAGVATPNDVQLSIVSSGTLRRIPIDGEWRLQLPLEERLLRENPTITTNLARGKPLLLRPQLAIVPLNGTEWPIVEIAEALRQANVSVKAQAGMFALFAPKAKSVLFRFGDPRATIRVQESLGSRTILANDAGDVEVTLDGKTVRDGARLILSSAPKAVMPLFPMSMTLTVDGDAK